MSKKFHTIFNVSGNVLRLRRVFKLILLGFFIESFMLHHIWYMTHTIWGIFENKTYPKWTWENFYWSWESNFIPFDKKFRCTRKCARSLARQATRKSSFFLGRILMKNDLFEGGRRDASANPSECEDGKTAVKKGFFSECLDGVQLPIQKCPDGLQFSQKDQTCMPGYLLWKRRKTTRSDLA